MFFSPQTKLKVMSQSPKIGYVLKRFPRLSETFILNELLELERLGSPIQIYSLIDVTTEDPGSPRHKLLQELNMGNSRGRGSKNCVAGKFRRRRSCSCRLR